MKFTALIMSFIAIFSQSVSQTGKTVWTKGGHTSAVKHLYFDDAGILLSSSGNDGQKMAGFYGGFVNDPSIYGWDINSGNIIESYSTRLPSYYYIQTLVYWNVQKLSSARATNSLAASAYEESSYTAFSTSESGGLIGTTIFVYERANHFLKDSIRVSNDSNIAFALHPFKNEIAYRSGATEITIRDISTKQTIRTITQPGALAMEYSPDGKTIAIATRGSGVTLWRLKTGEKYYSYSHNKPIKLLKYFNENGYLLAVDTTGEVLFCNTVLGSFTKEPSGHQAAVTGIATSGSQYAFSSLDSTISVWNLDDATIRNEIRFNNGVTAVAFKNDGETLAAGLENGDIHVTNLSGENRRNLSIFKGNSESVSVSSDKSSIAVKYVNSIGRPENYQLLNFTEGNLLKDIQTPQRYWRSVESKDHKIIAFVRNDSVFTAPFGDTVNLNFITKVVFMNNGLDDVLLTLSPDAKILAVSSVGQSFIKFWNLETKQEKGQIPKPLGLTKDSFSPDGTLFVTNDTSGYFGVGVWLMNNLSRKALISMDFKSAEFSPDNSHLIFLNPKSIVLWHIQSSQKVNIIVDTAYFNSASYLPGITDVVFSPDSRFIAIAQKKIYLIDIPKGEITHILNDPKAPEEFSYIDFSKDGRYLVSAGKSVRLWDLNGITSVEEEKPVFKTDGLLKVFPNPSNGILTLQHDGFKNISGGEIRIFNSLGILLKTIQTEFLKEMKVDCSELSGGVYFVELSSEKGVLSRTSFIIAQ